MKADSRHLADEIGLKLPIKIAANPLRHEKMLLQHLADTIAGGTTTLRAATTERPARIWVDFLTPTSEQKRIAENMRSMFGDDVEVHFADELDLMTSTPSWHRRLYAVHVKPEFKHADGKVNYPALWSALLNVIEDLDDSEIDRASIKDLSAAGSNPEYIATTKWRALDTTNEALRDSVLSELVRIHIEGRRDSDSIALTIETLHKVRKRDSRREYFVSRKDTSAAVLRDKTHVSAAPTREEDYYIRPIIFRICEFNDKERQNEGGSER